VLLLISTGMRWGEAAGLPGRAVNTGRGSVNGTSASLRPIAVDLDDAPDQQFT